MDLRTRLDPVLTVAGEHAYDVDAHARFPEETVAALRESGLLGLTVSPRWGDWAVVGGLVLLVTGALLLAGQRMDSAAGRRRFTLIAAGLALVAADARTTTVLGPRRASARSEAS